MTDLTQSHLSYGIALTSAVSLECQLLLVEQTNDKRCRTSLRGLVSRNISRTRADRLDHDRHLVLRFLAMPHPLKSASDSKACQERSKVFQRSETSNFLNPQSIHAWIRGVSRQTSFERIFNSCRLRYSHRAVQLSRVGFVYANTPRKSQQAS